MSHLDLFDGFDHNEGSYCWCRVTPESAIMSEAQQEVKKEESDIARVSNTLASRRLWRNIPYLTEVNKCGDLQLCGLKAHGKTPTLIPNRFSGLEIGVRQVFELFSFGAGH